MDIIDLIKDDHENIANLMDRVEISPDGSEESRKRIFEELKATLEAHTQSEEQTLYERLSEEDETAERVLDSYEEHQLVSETLQSLEELETNDEDWMEKFKVLRENVEQHVKREERFLLPKAAKVIPLEEREEMADAMVSLTEEFISEGVPEKDFQPFDEEEQESLY